MTTRSCGRDCGPSSSGNSASWVVGEAATAAEALDVVARTRPHIVLLDLKLSAESDVVGLQLCGRITERVPAPGVLVVTTFLDQRF